MWKFNDQEVQNDNGTPLIPFKPLNWDNLREYKENGISVLADNIFPPYTEIPLYFNKDYKFVRSVVANILAQYKRSGECVSHPIKCLDALGCAGASGLTWKKHLKNNVDVKINDQRSEACRLIDHNAQANRLFVEISNQDTCIALHERGYNFIYLDCTVEASHYFDAAFRHLARNGVVVVTTKDDSSMHGSSPDVALRRYGGHIIRVSYYHELGMRLFIAAMARSAAKYNKAINVLLCLVHKNTVTIAVKAIKSPDLATKTLDNIRFLKHCMVCEDRIFYPVGLLPVAEQAVNLSCACGETAPGRTTLELGPVWAGKILDPAFIEGILEHKYVPNIELKPILTLMLEEARCPTQEPEGDDERITKKLKLDLDQPPFYYNLHKHHPEVSQLMKLNKVIESLRTRGYRASKTHFDKLAVRTDAPLNKLLDVMKHLDNSQCK